MFSSADNFKILYINNGTVKVNGKEKKVGDIINDSDKISWSSGNQVIKVQCIENGMVKLLSARSMGEKGSVKDYYLKHNKLSTRKSIQYDDSLKCIYDINDMLNSTMEVHLYDTLYIKADIELEATDGFAIKYYYNNEIVAKRVHFNGEAIILTRDMLPEESDITKICLLFHSGRKKKTVELIPEIIVNTGKVFAEDKE